MQLFQLLIALLYDLGAKFYTPLLFPVAGSLAFSLIL